MTPQESEDMRRQMAEIKRLAKKGKGNISQHTVFLVTLTVVAFWLPICIYTLNLIIPIFWASWIGVFIWGVTMFGWYLPKHTIEVQPYMILVYQDPVLRRLWPVRQGHRTLLPFARLAKNGTIDLRRNDVVKNKENEFFLTADKKWVEIDWVVLLSPNPRFPINYMAYPIERVMEIFHEQVTNFLESFCVRFNADQIIGKNEKGVHVKDDSTTPQFKQFTEAFECQFLGDKEDSLFEVKHGVWTAIPQLGQVKVSKAIRDAQDAITVMEGLRDAAKVIKEGSDDSIQDRDAYLLAHAEKHPGSVNMFYFPGDPDGTRAAALGALTHLVGGKGEKKSGDKDKKGKGK